MSCERWIEDFGNPTIPRVFQISLNFRLKTLYKSRVKLPILKPLEWPIFLHVITCSLNLASQLESISIFSSSQEGEYLRTLLSRFHLWCCTIAAYQLLHQASSCDARAFSISRAQIFFCQASVNMFQDRCGHRSQVTNNSDLLRTTCKWLYLHAPFSWRLLGAMLIFQSSILLGLGLLGKIGQCHTWLCAKGGKHEFKHYNWQHQLNVIEWISYFNFRYFPQCLLPIILVQYNAHIRRSRISAL